MLHGDGLGAASGQEAINIRPIDSSKKRAWDRVITFRTKRRVTKTLDRDGLDVL